jgi:hypothetical protein
MWVTMRVMLATVIALAAAGFALAQDVGVGKPAYDEVGNALIFPVGSRENRSGLVSVSLSDFRASSVPIPCGHDPFSKLVFLDQGRILAAWGSPASKPANLKKGNALLPERERFWHPYEIIFLARDDWRVVHKLDLSSPFVIRDDRSSATRYSIGGISAPDGSETLFLAMSSNRVKTRTAIYRLSIRDWQIELLWPTKTNFDYRTDDSFLDLSAPDWIEDGSLVVRGRPRDENKQWNVAKEKRHHKNRWLINPADQSVRLHPRNDMLHYGWTVQKVDGDVYMDEIIGASGPNKTFEYGLKRVLPGPVQLLGSLGGAPNWVYVFSGHGKRYVVWQARDGSLSLRSLPEFRDAGPIDTSRFGTMAKRWECPEPWNP